ncbi:restriction endonuclease subunit S [Enterococcus malodoratus]|uniref:restriction endonuclease subunit S n=1 Tax=Enterococcus malodoratus TaxID=71451 RepID=UPI000DD0097D|nr:restriction endonuclease subunit S [Enterococcus malodoratus]
MQIILTYRKWEQRKVFQFAKDTYGGGTPKTSVKEFWNGAIPWIQSSDLETNRLFNVSPKKKITDEAVQKSATKIIPSNSIAIVTRVGVGKLALMSFEYATSQDFLSLSELQVDPYFGSYSLYTMLQKELNNIQGTSIKGMTKSDLLEKRIMIPKNAEEQKKIGTLFKQLDYTITLHQCKLEQLKRIKKAFLQLLFPVDDEKIPRLRFADFEEDWGQRQLKDVLKSHSFKQYLAEPRLKGEFEIIQQGDKPIIGYAEGEAFAEYADVTLFGDHTVSLYKPKRPFFVATDGVKILSADGFDGQYLFSTLERYKPESQGYKRHFTILKNEGIWFTKNSDEQIKIGSFFKQLDNTIALYQHKSNQLEQLKQAYLQKMFI